MWSVLRSRLLSFLVVFALVFLLVAALVANSTLELFTTYFGRRLAVPQASKSVQPVDPLRIC